MCSNTGDRVARAALVVAACGWPAAATANHTLGSDDEAEYEPNAWGGFAIVVALGGAIVLV